MKLGRKGSEELFYLTDPEAVSVTAPSSSLPGRSGRRGAYLGPHLGRKGDYRNGPSLQGPSGPAGQLAGVSGRRAPGGALFCRLSSRARRNGPNTTCSCWGSRQPRWFSRILCLTNWTIFARSLTRSSTATRKSRRGETTSHVQSGHRPPRIVVACAAVATGGSGAHGPACCGS